MTDKLYYSPPKLFNADGKMELTTEGDCCGWLEEIETPENSEMDGIEYLGPQVVESTD